EISHAPKNPQKLLALYEEYEFRSWIREVEASATSEEENEEEVVGEDIALDYQTILSQAHLDQWLTRLRASSLFAFDTETTSLDYMEAQIVGVSFALRQGEAAYVPLGHDYLDAPDQLDRQS